MALASTKDRRQRVARVVLSSADISVVNRTTLSLWHFQQLAQTLLPCEAALRAKDGDGSDDSLDPDHTLDASGENMSASATAENSSDLNGAKLAATHRRESAWRRRGVSLGEGMSVAAIAFEPDASETSESDSSSESDGDGDDKTTLTLESVDCETEPHAEPAMTTLSLRDKSADALSSARLTPATDIAVVYRGYRCVVCFDASPSTLSIDPTTGRLFLDMLYESVEVRRPAVCLRGRYHVLSVCVLSCDVGRSSSSGDFWAK